MQTKQQKFWTRGLKLLKDQWFLAVMAGCVGFVFLVSAYKLFLKEDQFVYAKVKVSQGLWWASTQRPPAWFVKSIKPGMIDKSLLGEPNTRVINVTYYPYYSSSQYDIYLTLKLKVTGNEKKGTYNYNRSALAVGSPVEFAFPGAEFSGTVIALGQKQFKEKTAWKTVTLVKSAGYQWEYDAIQVGDKYYNGQETVFVVLDKTIYDNPQLGIYNNVSTLQPEARKTITVTAKIKATLGNFGQLYYGEEQELKVGKTLNLSTNNFFFQEFQLAAIN